MQEIIIKPDNKMLMHEQKRIEKEFAKALDSKETKKVNLDLSDVGLLFSQSLAVVVNMAKRCKKNEILFEVVNVRPDHYTLFDNLRLTEVLTVKKPKCV